MDDDPNQRGVVKIERRTSGDIQLAARNRHTGQRQRLVCVDRNDRGRRSIGRISAGERRIGHRVIVERKFRAAVHLHGTGGAGIKTLSDRTAAEFSDAARNLYFAGVGG